MEKVIKISSQRFYRESLFISFIFLVLLMPLAKFVAVNSAGWFINFIAGWLMLFIIPFIFYFVFRKPYSWFRFGKETPLEFEGMATRNFLSTMFIGHIIQITCMILF